MNSCKTPAYADPLTPELEPELKPDLAADDGAQGPMAQQDTGGAGVNELHPQQLVQLVGFRDPDAGKHEEDAAVAESIAAVLASAA
jgi:hypothetical protein